MLLRQPLPLRVLIDDVNVSVAVLAAKQYGCVMREAVVESGEPFVSRQWIKVGDDVRVAPKMAEELARGDVPITIEPRAFLPAGQCRQPRGIVRIREAVVG